MTEKQERTSWADESEEVEETKPVTSAWKNAWSKAPEDKKVEQRYNRDYPGLSDKPEEAAPEEAENRKSPRGEGRYEGRREEGGRYEGRRDEGRYEGRREGGRYEGRRDEGRRYEGRRDEGRYEGRRDREDRGDREYDDRGGRRFQDRPERTEKRRDPVPFPESAPYTAYIGNLSYDTKPEDLSEKFGATCKVINVRLQSSKEGRPKGYGYIEFEDADSLRKALQLDGADILNRQIKVDIADARPERTDDRRRGDFSRDRPRDSFRDRPRDSFQNRSRDFSDRPRDDRPREDRSPREERDAGEAEKPKERPKLQLNPRSAAPGATPSAETTAYKASSKPNPFGEAKPRDENEIMKKKEEERKSRPEAPDTKPKTPDAPTYRPPYRREDNKDGRPKEDRPPREDRPRRDDRSRDDRPQRRSPRRDDRPRDDRPRRDGPPRRDDRPRRDEKPADKPPRREDRPPKEEKQTAKTLTVKSENIFAALGDDE